MAPFDMNNLMQTYAMMGALGGGGFGGMTGGMDFLPASGPQPQPNAGRYAEGYEVRRALRSGIMAQQQARMRAGGGMSGMYSPSPYPSFGMGMDPSSIKDSGVANQALAPYGLQLPTHVNPFLLFNDQKADGSPTWAANHPKVARAVEGAMIGASVGPSATPGEAISNVSRTIMGMPNLYHENAANQMMAPFAMAKQLAGLQEDQQRIQLQSAQIDEYKARAARDARTPINKKQPYWTPDQGPLAFDPEEGTFTSATLNGQTISGPLYKPGSPQKPGSNTFPAGVGKTRPERLAWAQWLKDPKYDAQNPDALPLDWDSRVERAVSRDSSASGGGSTAGRKGTGQGKYGDLSQTDEATMKSLDQDVAFAQSRVKEKITPSMVRGRSEASPSDKMNAERKERQDALNAATRKRDEALSAARKNQTSGAVKTGAGGGSLMPIIHPDGTITFERK